MRLDLEGPFGGVAAVVPGCAAPGLSGGLGPRLAVNVEVEVGVIVPGPCVTCRCFLRAPLTLVVPLVSKGGPRVVLTSGGWTHGVLVSRGVTQNTTHTLHLTVCAPR